MALREVLGHPLPQRVPDHSTLRRTRQRLPLAAHQAVFALILGLVETNGLLKGRVWGVDSTYLRADVSMNAIVRRDTTESYTEFVTRLVTEACVPTPTAEDAQRLDRKRTGKTTSNREGVSRTDRDARIATLKDGRNRLADTPEQVVDLETGTSVAAVVIGAGSRLWGGEPDHFVARNPPESCIAPWDPPVPGSARLATPPASRGVPGQWGCLPRGQRRRRRTGNPTDPRR